MEMLLQIFMTAIAASVFVVLLAKFASAANNGDEHDGKHKAHDSGKVVELKLRTEKISSKTKSKSKKKVRFAVDDDEFVVNRIVAGPLEMKQVVVDKNCEEETMILNEVGMKAPEEGFGGVENQRERAQGVLESVIDHDQTKGGQSELVDRRLSEGTTIGDLCEETLTDGDEDKICMKLLSDDNVDEDEKEKAGLISDEDDSDWEGVERSELEKVFAMAANYGQADDHLQSLGNDIQMQLYGLHKVAMEGPCHEAQPMALKVSARAKWNAWQKLGNMSPDVAMEQYITLLSEKVPGWSPGIHSVGLDLSSSNTTSIIDISQKERERELESCSDGGDLIGVSDFSHYDEDKQ